MGKVIRTIRVIKACVTNFRKDVILLGAQGHLPENANVRVRRSRLLAEIVNAEPLKLANQSVPEIFVTSNRTVSGSSGFQALRRAGED